MNGGCTPALPERSAPNREMCPTVKCNGHSTDGHETKPLVRFQAVSNHCTRGLS